MSTRKKYIEDNNLGVNYTTLFLLPLLEYTQAFWPDEFISSYIIDELKTKIVLVFENSNGEDLKETLMCIQNHEDFISMDYDDEDKEIVCIIGFPKEFDIDFNLFKIGRYSKFSKECKELLLDYHTRKTGSGKCIMMIDCLFPDYLAKKFRADKLGVSISDLPNGEVMSIPNMDLELYCKTGELNTQIHKEI